MLQEVTNYSKDFEAIIKSPSELGTLSLSRKYSLEWILQVLTGVMDKSIESIFVANERYVVGIESQTRPVDDGGAISIAADQEAPGQLRTVRPYSQRHPLYHLSVLLYEAAPTNAPTNAPTDGIKAEKTSTTSKYSWAGATGNNEGYGYEGSSVVRIFEPLRSFGSPMAENAKVVAVPTLQARSQSAPYRCLFSSDGTSVVEQCLQHSAKFGNVIGGTQKGAVIDCEATSEADLVGIDAKDLSEILASLHLWHETDDLRLPSNGFRGKKNSYKPLRVLGVVIPGMPARYHALIRLVYYPSTSPATSTATSGVFSGMSIREMLPTPLETLASMGGVLAEAAVRRSSHLATLAHALSDSEASKQEAEFVRSGII